MQQISELHWRSYRKETHYGKEALSKNQRQPHGPVRLEERNIVVKTFITLLFTICVCSPVLAGDGKVQKSRRPVPRQYLVQFSDFVEAPAKEAREIARQSGVKLR